MNKIKKNKAQAGSAGKKTFFSDELINGILCSSDPKEELKGLLDGKSKDFIISIYSEYLGTHCSCFNKDFEALLASAKFGCYSSAFDNNIVAFKQPERFCFIKDNYNFALLSLTGKCFISSQFDKEFERFVATQSHKTFIEAIRTSRAFLDDERLDFYTQNVDLKIPSEHLEMWKFLKEKECTLWKKVKESFEVFENENKKLTTVTERFCSAMVEIVLWMERKRWEAQDEILSDLQECYNQFVEKYCRDCGVTMLELDEKEAEEELIRQLDAVFKKNNSSVANELFEAILSWVGFKNRVLDLYCFDMTFKPNKVKLGSLYLSNTPLLYYGRQLNEYRYEYNRDYYLSMGMEATDQQKSPIVNKDEMNLTACDRMFSTQLLLEDLCLDKITRNGKDILIGRAFDTLIGLSTNRLYRYEKTQESLKQRGIKTWEEAYVRCGYANAIQGIKVLPFTIYTKSMFFQQTKEAGYPEDTVNVMSQLFDLFCFKSSFSGRFDDSKRLNTRTFDVISKPFLEIGKEIYFTPTMFIANNDWFYASAEKVIELLNKDEYAQGRKDSSDMMEDFLAGLFNGQKGWSAVCPHNDGKGKEGDVDIIVEDNETALLIQLKRSKFRTTHRDRFLEMLNVDSKAAFQVNKYPYDGKKKNVVRWYVTNSFESCLKVFKSGKTSCTKVNYFDLIHLLVLDDWSTLDELINFVTSDSYMKRLGLKIPLEIPSRAYRLLLKTEDVVSQEKLDGILDKSNSIDADERLKIAEELSHSIHDDYRVWDVLADIYTDKGEFDKAIDCCKRALKIIGCDPFLLYNYAMTLHKKRECHALILPPSEEERSIAKNLMEQYWFLDFGQLHSH